MALGLVVTKRETFDGDFLLTAEVVTIEGMKLERLWACSSEGEGLVDLRSQAYISFRQGRHNHTSWSTEYYNTTVKYLSQAQNILKTLTKLQNVENAWTEENGAVGNFGQWINIFAKALKIKQVFLANTYGGYTFNGDNFNSYSGGDAVNQINWRIETLIQNVENGTNGAKQITA